MIGEERKKRKINVLASLFIRSSSLLFNPSARSWILVFGLISAGTAYGTVAYTERQNPNGMRLPFDRRDSPPQTQLFDIFILTRLSTVFIKKAISSGDVENSITKRHIRKSFSLTSQCCLKMPMQIDECDWLRLVTNTSRGGTNIWNH